MSKIFVYASSN